MARYAREYGGSATWRRGGMERRYKAAPRRRSRPRMGWAGYGREWGGTYGVERGYGERGGYGAEYDYTGRTGYGARYGYGAEPRYERRYGAGSPYGTEYGYGAEYRYGRGPCGRGFGGERLPRKPARGYPVRGIHTYNLDYGDVSGGPTTDYSGRAGYDTDQVGMETPRGPYTPRLEEIGREARRRRRLYGREGWPYSGRQYGGWR